MVGQRHMKPYEGLPFEFRYIQMSRTENTADTANTAQLKFGVRLG